MTQGVRCPSASTSACRIVRDLTGASLDEAKAALEAHRWVVKDAYEALKRRKS